MKAKNQIKSRRWFRQRWFQYSVLTVICLSLGLIDGVRSFVNSYHGGIFYADFGIALRWDVIGWSIWIFFIPFIFWMLKRIPLNQDTCGSGLSIYLLVGIVLALVRVIFPALFSVLFFEGLEHLMQWLPDKFYILITDFLTAFIFYSLVLALGQAMSYYKQYREEELRTSQLEAQLSNAQLQALKMQLHPHFLFNALNSISALQMEDAEKAQQMTARLGDFLRLTLENVGVQEVSLKQEIEFLKCYLDIEQVRFGKRLSTDIKVAPEVRDCRIPNLVLQPLVENAIRHGIAPQTKAGHIDITAVRENGWLKVEIEDNGQGIKNKNISEVFSNGIGLSNTRARLQQFYGANFRFEIESLAEQGLIVTLRLPPKYEDGLLN